MAGIPNADLGSHLRTAPILLSSGPFETRLAYLAPLSAERFVGDVSRPEEPF